MTELLELEDARIEAMEEALVLEEDMAFELGFGSVQELRQAEKLWDEDSRAFADYCLGR